jgi:flagellar basal-body rod modification protein FlgD|tara:strand:+ start:4704 stop:5399 length:696 start_codon:yes stop_codon:yes gene_type:complete
VGKEMAETNLIDPAVAAAQTRSQKSGVSLAADLDSFLLLLTTQLKHQDPLSPLEPTEFTGQLVQFASVEQQIATNDHMEQLVNIQNASLASSIIGFVGTDVEAEVNQVPLQDGEANFTYTLSNNAKNVVLTISDDKGNIMLTKAGERTAGDHEFVWDGKNVNGQTVPDGGYHVSVTPIGFTDSPVTAKVKVRGHVTGVNMENGNTMIDAGGVMIPLDKILSIKEPKTGLGL